MTKLSPRIEASRSAQARKKNSAGVKAARAKETPKERELHHARIAVAYRRSHAKNLFDLRTYAGRRDAKAWIAVAERRLQKALA